MRHFYLVLLVVLAVGMVPSGADAAFSASIDVSPQTWSWYDKNDVVQDKHRHTRTKISLEVPVIGRLSGQLANHIGDVFTGFEAGVGYMLLGTGQDSLTVMTRHHRWSIDTDQPYTVEGLGYGARAGLTLSGSALEASYVVVPDAVASSESKKWDVSGYYITAGADVITLGPLRLRAGYVREAFTVSNGGKWTNEGAQLGAVIRF